MLAVGRRTQSSSATNNNFNSSSSSSSSRNKTNELCRLSFYDSPPSLDVDIDTFEMYGIARLQVLRRIDVLIARGVTGDNLTKEINKADSQQLFTNGVDGGTCNGTDKDQISHYILRMAYCQTEELRRWFLSNECKLFKIRYDTSKASSVDQFLRDRDVLMQYPPISGDEKIRLRPKLIGLYDRGSSSSGGSGGNSTSNKKEYNYNTTDFYKVPFVDVMALVSRREVYIEAGYAYVSRSKILSIVEGKFRTSLSKSLIQTYQMKFMWSSDTRIASIVNKLSKVAFQYGGSTSIVGGGINNGTLSAANPQRIVQIFVDYLTTVMGHSDPKTKPAGVNKLYVSVGTKRPNTCDKSCPIANRMHKSNSQKYTIFFDTFVMEQGCWDGVCQATGRHVYYQIKENGRCVKVGWTPPPLDTTMIANTQMQQCQNTSNTNTNTSSSSSSPQQTAAKKMKLSPTKSMQVSP